MKRITYRLQSDRSRKPSTLVKFSVLLVVSHTVTFAQYYNTKKVALFRRYLVSAPGLASCIILSDLSVPMDRNGHVFLELC